MLIWKTLNPWIIFPYGSENKPRLPLVSTTLLSKSLHGLPELWLTLGIFVKQPKWIKTRTLKYSPNSIWPDLIFPLLWDPHIKFFFSSHTLCQKTLLFQKDITWWMLQKNKDFLWNEQSSMNLLILKTSALDTSFVSIPWMSMDCK